MNRETLDDKLQRIAYTYGFMAQARQTMEESGELIVAVNKYIRALESNKNCDEARNSLISEMADVRIMVQQMTKLLDCEKDLDDWIRLKVERQLERLRRKYSSEI